MTYRLLFHELALKEWYKLDPTIREQFKKKLTKILANPHIASLKLNNMKDCYKVKLRSIGYRLVYKIVEDKLIVQVIAVGVRNKNYVYEKAFLRLN
ncbi:MAG: type II toxin-antitoxin system RelE family toxin [Janthinobacterium lividum]